MADKGINSPQFKCVEKNYARLTGHLKTNKEAKNKLFKKFVSGSWHGHGDCPSENDLINIAMERIEYNHCEYGVFIEMLEQVSGMRDIVKNLKGLWNCPSYMYIIIINFVCEC